MEEQVSAASFPPGTSLELLDSPGPRSPGRGPVTTATAEAPASLRPRRGPEPRVARTPRPQAGLFPRGGGAAGGGHRGGGARGRARMRGMRQRRPLPQAGYSQTAPNTPDRRHSQRYHHVTPSSCSGGAELTDAPAVPSAPLMVPPSGAPAALTKGSGAGRVVPARCLVGEAAAY